MILILLQNHLVDLPHTLQDWVWLAIAVIVGSFAIAEIWNKKSKQKRDEIIKLLNEELEIVKGTLARETKLYLKNAKKINELMIEKETLASILKGTDDESRKYRAQILDAIEKIHDTKEAIDGLSVQMRSLEESFNKHVELSRT